MLSAKSVTQIRGINWWDEAPGMGTKDFASSQVGVCHVAAAWYKGTITHNPLFTYTVHRPHTLHRDEVLFEFIFHFFQSS